MCAAHSSLQPGAPGKAGAIVLSVSFVRSTRRHSDLVSRSMVPLSLHQMTPSEENEEKAATSIRVICAAVRFPRGGRLFARLLSSLFCA